MGEMGNAYKILIGKPEEKRPPVGPRRRWEDDIRMDDREIRGEVVVWMILAQNRFEWQALMDLSFLIVLFYLAVSRAFLLVNLLDNW
jgi:hypothetical protein